MRYREISQDLDEVKRLGKARADGRMTDAEVVYYTLRVWHQMAVSLQQLVDLQAAKQGRRTGSAAIRW